MKPIYLVNSEQYARMATQAYEDYLTANFLEKREELFSEPDSKNNLQMAIHLAQRKDDSYVKSIVFLAMAIESYVNLMGAYLTDEETYYARSRKKPIEWKLRYISQKIGKTFPKDLRKRIIRLFEKRNRLVHQKPRSFSFDIINDDEETIRKQKKAFWKELSFGMDGINEDEISLYSELKQVIQKMRGAKHELLTEIRLHQ